MAIHRFRIKKGDNVQVLQGRDAGRRGIVEHIVPSTGRVVVDGVNVHKRHAKPRSIAQPGGIIDFNAPLDISNVMLVCPACDKPTRVGFQIDGDRKWRYCRKCNERTDD